MLAGKIVPNLKCECGHQFKAFVCAADEWKCSCPACGKTVHESDRAFGGNRFYGNRRFAEGESISRCQGFRPQEVRRARKNLPQFQHCIRDDGTVVFSDRKEERKFAAAQDRWFDSLQGGDPSPAVPKGIWGG